MRYFITPKYDVAFNPKVGSSTLARAIVRAFYPEVEGKIQKAAYPAGKNPDNSQWQSLCPNTETPERPVILLVRDPALRFRSAMAQFRLTDVDAAMDSLENGTPIPLARAVRPLHENVHFQRQSALAAGTTKLYRFPDDLDAAAVEIGLSLPLPIINEATDEKPALTPEQEERVRSYYAADVALYESITRPGQQYTAPAAPETPEALVAAKVAKIARIEAAYVTDLAEGITVDGITLAAADSDQAKFTQLSVLLDAIERGLPSIEAKAAFQTSEQIIVDLHNGPHTMSVSDLRGLMVAYGQQIAAKWAAMAARRAAVAVTATIAEVESA